MANQELMRIVDGIARDKNIEREQVYVDIEQAVASGLRKQFNTEDTSEFTVAVDRTNGEISVTRGGETESWARSHAAHERLRQTEDVSEGIGAFFEKRPPVWTGR